MRPASLVGTSTFSNAVMSSDTISSGCNEDRGTPAPSSMLYDDGILFRTKGVVRSSGAFSLRFLFSRKRSTNKSSSDWSEKSCVVVASSHSSPSCVVLEFRLERSRFAEKGSTDPTVTARNRRQTNRTEIIFKIGCVLMVGLVVVCFAHACCLSHSMHGRVISDRCR